VDFDATFVEFAKVFFECGNLALTRTLTKKKKRLFKHKLGSFASNSTYEGLFERSLREKN
jgi:hypothetical protein